MKPLFAVLLAAIICFTGEAASVSDSIKTIRAVGPEGQGNAAAAKAWQSLAQADAAAARAAADGMETGGDAPEKGQEEDVGAMKANGASAPRDEF